MTEQNSLVNGDSAGYWAAAAEGRLVFQKCASCGNVQFPPRHQCSRCWSPELVPLESTGRGVIEGTTIVRRAPLTAFRNRVPYVVAAARMEEGPRLLANVLGENAEAAAIGDPVTVVFVPDADGRTLPQFTLADPADRNQPGRRR